MKQIGIDANEETESEAKHEIEKMEKKDKVIEETEKSCWRLRTGW